MAFKDNRDFIAALDRTGDVVHVKREVDWDLEAGAILLRAYEKRDKAPLFEKIKDYPEGFRIFGGPVATFRRLAIAMGLAPDTPIKGLQEEYRRRIKNPIKPIVVKNAPCKENKMFGDDVDLCKFPIPLVHDGDGGRYLTWHAAISKDLDTDWSNWGLYRLMLYNRRHFCIMTLAHLGMMFFREYEPRNQPMPIAVAIGMDCLSTLVAAIPIRYGQNEADYAGALRQEPVELVKCETSDLLVPAHAEIVLEGEMLPNIRVPEGPFGEYPGYRTRGGPWPVVRVKAITYRNNPIIPMVSPSLPYYDGTINRSIILAIDIEDHLREHGVPVVAVHAFPEWVSHMCVVSVRNKYSGIASQIEDIIASEGQPMPKVIVVDEDVDVFDMGEVLHALAVKCHPVRGIKVTDRERATPLTPFLNPTERLWLDGANAVFDCTWPVSWNKDTDIPVKVSFKELRQEVREQIIKNWESYGFK